jgi:hypothetical protein
MPPMIGWRAMSLLIGLALLGGCGSGRLLILLDAPPEDRLNPLKDSRLAKFSLRVSQSGQTTDQEAFRGSDAELVVGTVPTGGVFDLRLAGKSAADEMLGLGAVRDVQAISDGESSVKVYFRKPIGYVGGQNRVEPLNAAAGTGDSVELGTVQLASISRVSDVAATPNGAWVLIAADSFVVPILTSNHSVLERVVLKASVGCVTVSPDGRYAVVCHKTGLSVLDLGNIGNADVQYRTVEVKGGEPTRVVFSDRRTAQVLVNGHSPLGSCPGTPGLLGTLDVESPDTVVATSMKQAVADIGVDPRDGTLLLALPCVGAGTLGRVGAGGAAESLAVQVPAPYDIAVTEKSIVVVGRAAATSTERGQIVRFDLTNPGFATADNRSFTFPPLEVWFRSSASTSGFFSWVSEASNLRIHHLTVAPDARRAIALYQADFASDISLGPCSFRSRGNGAGYLVLDLASGTLVMQRLARLQVSDCYANCLVNGLGQSLSTLSTCIDEFKRVMQGNKLLVSPEFEPASTTLLFGG